MITNASYKTIYLPYIADFHLTMSNNHVKPGQSVQFVAKLNGDDNLKDFLDCFVEYERKGIQLEQISLSSLTFTAQHSFQYPESYSVHAKCYYRAGGASFKTEDLTLYVECGLSPSTLQISHKELNMTFLKPVELIFYHRYCFPVSYSLLLDDVIIAHNQTEQVLDEAKFMLKVFVEVNFNVNSSMQQLVGPGIHNVRLLLQNRVSFVIYSTPINFNEEIKNFEVAVKEFVGFHPHYFIINVTVSEGAPIIQP